MESHDRVFKQSEGIISKLLSPGPKYVVRMPEAHEVPIKEISGDISPLLAVEHQLRDPAQSSF
jgi:hypothetical protein